MSYLMFIDQALSSDKTGKEFVSERKEWFQYCCEDYERGKDTLYYP
jgi:hypothetical protein